MPIVPRHFFGDFDRFFEEWPELPEYFFPRRDHAPLMRTPRMDIYEDNGNAVAEVELPGVDPKNIEVEVKDNLLTVEARMEEKKEEKKKGYYRKEISSGYYKRAVPLPMDVIGEKAEAEYKGGILKIVIPKAKPKKEERKGIKIKIRGTKTA
jgi:HSP20 family protein